MRTAAGIGRPQRVPGGWRFPFMGIPRAILGGFIPFLQSYTDSTPARVEQIFQELPCCPSSPTPRANAGVANKKGET